MLTQERKLNRLRNYNYNSVGFYFVTICIKNRFDCFGYIKNNQIILNQYGMVVRKYWTEIPNHYQNIAIDEFVIMPDHIHGIIKITPTKSVGAEQCSTPTEYIITGINEKNYGLLSKVVKSFKNMVTNEIRQNFHDHEFQWQRSFYDHIIRGQEAFDNICWYIKNNPSNWKCNINNV